MIITPAQADSVVIVEEWAPSSGVLAPDNTDEALALQFAEEHGDHLRYVAAWGKWMMFDGAHWKFDDTLHAFDLARRIARDAAAACDDRIAMSIASAKTVAAVERLAKADRRLAATVDQWDTDDWMLNTPGGVVDLHTGQSRPHCAIDYLTKITAVAPDASCPTPLWSAFLNRVTDGNDELGQYLGRVLGYALTGRTTEHALFFNFGFGANGKSVLTGTAAGILNTYHVAAPIEAFTASSSDRHPTDLAGLRGARLVTAVETEDGRRWAESRVKALTGGDRIAARFMRQDFFEYQPKFKLLISGNHKPALRSVDEAMRRRFHLIPFSVTILASERDPHLPERLKAEWPGILAWMIEGCLKWQTGGLRPPDAVRAATDAYLEAEDAIGAWLSECCAQSPKLWESSHNLFKSWSVWADQAGEAKGSQKLLAQKLEAHGFTPRRDRKRRGFAGLYVLSKGDF